MYQNKLLKFADIQEAESPDHGSWESQRHDRQEKL